MNRIQIYDLLLLYNIPFLQNGRFKFKVYGDVSRSIHNFGLELAMCFEDKVECKKEFEHCIGGCSGDLTSKLHYDFATMIAVSELNPDVLGEDGFFASASDCNVRQAVIEVDLFPGGDSFRRFANRLQVASGMTAIDNTWCFENPLSCGIVERAIERSPGLRFVNGEFRHAYDGDPPSPPPPPTPPPRTLFCTLTKLNPHFLKYPHAHTTHTLVACVCRWACSAVPVAAGTF